MTSLISVRGAAPRVTRGRDLSLIASVAFLVLVVVAAIGATWIAPHDPAAIDLAGSLADPHAEHPLGTDQSGRDLLSRVMSGARISVLGPLAVLLIAAVLGIGTGLLAAWRGGWADAVVTRLTDVMFAFPGLLFAVFTVAVVGKGLTASVLALGLAFFPTVAKLTRSVAQAEMQRAYVDAYRVQGMSGTMICATRVLPNVAPVILGYVAVLFGDVLMGLAGLSYLGFGAQPPSSDWGLMVSEAELAMVQGSLWSSLVPATAIVLTVVSVNIVGVRLADRLSRTVSS